MATDNKHDPQDAAAKERTATGRHMIAKRLVSLAGAMLGEDHGVTVIVHDRTCEQAGGVGISTTLPNRAAQRGLLGAVILELLRIDGRLQSEGLAALPALAEGDTMAWLNRGKPST